MRSIDNLFQELNIDLANCCYRGQLVVSDEGVYVSLDEPQALALEDRYKGVLYCDAEYIDAATALFTTSLTSTNEITSALNTVYSPSDFVNSIVVINLDTMQVATYQGVVSLRYSDAPGLLSLTH